MAVELATTIQHFQGLSTDEMPDSAPEGSIFHAVDTGDEFVRYEGGWTLDLRKAAALKRSLML